MKTNRYILLFAHCLILSCNQPAKNKFAWLEGKWVQTNGEANFHEEWTRVNDTLLNGNGFVVDGNDTLFSEKLTLKVDHEAADYIVEMETGRVAVFKLTEETENEFVFEMPENDFPSKITYSQKSDNELLVVLEGEENGKEIRDELFFTKQ